MHILQRRPHNRNSSNFDAVPARDGRTTDGETNSNTAQTLQKFFAPKFPYPPIVAFQVLTFMRSSKSAQLL